MSRFPLEEIENKVGSKFSAVVAIAKRALRSSQRFLDTPVGRNPNPLRSAMEDILSGRGKVQRGDGASATEPRDEKKEGK